MAAVTLLIGGCVPDFGAFSVIDDAGADASVGLDAGRDASAPTDAGPGPEDAGPGDAGTDAGGFVPSAIDTVCDTPWAELSDPPPPGCAGRAVETVATPFESLAVALGRGDDGTIVVAYNEVDGPDTGRVGTAVFDEDDPGAATEGPPIEPVSVLGDVVGTHLRVATEAPDTHHVALWYRSDFGHEVQLHTLRGGAFAPPLTVASGVGRAGVLDAVIDADGHLAVAWHDDTTGRHAARRADAVGAFGPERSLRSPGDSRMVGHGAISLAAGATGNLHAVYQWPFTLAASAPSYSQAMGDTWSVARTLDNTAVENRSSGVGVDVTVQGSEVVAAYLDWRDGVGEIRVARIGRTPDPEVSTFMMGVVIAEQPGDHPIEIATDRNGWLHLLVADSSATGTSLQYHRQTRVGGELRWIMDTVAEFTGAPERVYVDLKLGPDRRPHIVFWDPTVGRVRYATAAP